MTEKINLAIDALAAAAFIEGGVSPEKCQAARDLTDQRKRELVAVISAPCLHQIQEPASVQAVQPVICDTCNDHGMIGGPSFYDPGEGGQPCPDCEERHRNSLAAGDLMAWAAEVGGNRIAENVVEMTREDLQRLIAERTPQTAPAAVAVPKDWMEHLGFILDAPADGIWLVIDDTGAQREANLTERVLWKELMAIRAALAATPAAAPVIDWEAAAEKIAIEVAKNCGTVPNLTHPYIYLGLKELFAGATAAAAPVDKSPELQGSMVDKTVNLQGAAAAPVVLPEPDAVISEVMGLVDEWGMESHLRGAAELDAQHSEATQEEIDCAKDRASKERAAWKAIESKLRALLATATGLPAQTVEPHPDDVAVDALAALMKAKLAKQRDKGYGGWDTDCTRERLSELLRAHIEKGDPVDVANFCAFLSARGEGIAAHGTSVPVANCYSDDDGDTWRDCPDDCEFVEGRALGEEFELQASIRSWAEVFRVTKVPDETSDDYEVEPVSIRTTAAPQAQADARDAGKLHFWVADDPDTAHESLHEAVMEAFETNGVQPGGFVEIQREISLPNILVRITSTNPFAFEEVPDAAIAAAKGAI